MLQSPNPRQQAWGAFLSARHVLPETIPWLEQVVSRRIMSVAVEDAAAADLALDALVQMNAAVSPDLLLVVHDRRPAQALALLANHRGDADGALLTLMGRETSLSWYTAANLALGRRLTRAAAVLLNGLTITAPLVVSEDGNVGLGAGSGGIALGCGAIGLAPGLPPWPAYALTSFSVPGVVVLAPGPTPIYYRRTVAPAGQTPAINSVSIGGLSAADRLKYLAALGGIDAAAMPLSGDESYSHEWQDMAAVDDAVTRAREDLLRRYAQLLRLLVEARVLAEEDAKALPVPQLTIILRDARRSRVPPLDDLRRD